MGHDEDTKVLHSMGYAQELSRRMGGFSNFAISFSIICILAGGITSFPLAMATGGAFEATIGWIVGGVFALVVATSMGQIASAYPTAGALYHWSSILGGRGWGWATAWINLLGLIFVVASVNVGVWQLFRDLVVSGVFHVDVTSWTAQSTDPLPTGMTLDQVNAINNHAYYVQVGAVVLITLRAGVGQSFRHQADHAADRLLRLPHPGRCGRLDGDVPDLGCKLGFLPSHNIREQHG